MSVAGHPFRAATAVAVGMPGRFAFARITTASGGSPSGELIAGLASGSPAIRTGGRASLRWCDHAPLLDAVTPQGQATLAIDILFEQSQHAGWVVP
jgi:hypothetical protein